jgi:hypothetical protein
MHSKTEAVNDQVDRASIRNQQQLSPVFVERPVDKVWHGRARC